MNVTIEPAKLCGSITPPPSKSQAHRMILAAALAEGESVLSRVAFSDDILATLSCMEQLGAAWETVDESTIRIRGIGGKRRRCDAEHLPRFDCGESGSTLRFLIPVALAVAGGGVFTGHGRLMKRPQRPYFEIFEEKGIFYEVKDDVLTVRGELKPGEYHLPGDVSSQFFTGLLYALPLLDGPSEILATTQKIESIDYIAMTLEVLRLSGAEAKWLPEMHGLTVKNSSFTPIEKSIECDWSQAAFWYAAAGIGNEVTVTGMNMDSIQGDKEILCWGERIDGKPIKNGISVPVYAEGKSASEQPIAVEEIENRPHSASVDVSRNPDLVPPAAAWGALMNGALYFRNAGRLRIKESDRLASVHQVLSAMGAQVEEEEDRLIIQGLKTLRGGVTVDSCNDHRIAMMAAIAATRCDAPVTITNAECVKKSYPNFWDDYERLGGRIIREETT